MNISNSITSLLFWICVKLIQVCTGVTKKEPISFLERRYTRRYVPIFLSFFSVLAIFQIFIFLFSPIFRLSDHDTRSRPAKSVSEINFSQLYPQIIVLKTSKTTTLSSHEYISCLLWFFRSEDGLSGLLLDGRWLTTLRRCWPFKSCKEAHENEGLLSYIIISSILSWRWRFDVDIDVDFLHRELSCWGILSHTYQVRYTCIRVYGYRKKAQIVSDCLYLCP